MSISKEDEVRLQELTKTIGEIVIKQFPNAPAEYVKEVLLQELVASIKNPNVEIMTVLRKIHSRLKN